MMQHYALIVGPILTASGCDLAPEKLIEVIQSHILLLVHLNYV